MATPGTAYVIDSKGFLENLIMIDVDNPPEGVILEPLPSSLFKPKWNKKSKKWVEGLPKKELESKLKEKEDNLRKVLVSRVRAKAKTLIEEIAPIYKQLNWHADGIFDTPEVQEKVKKIKEIRDNSNKLEAQIDGLSSLKELEEFSEKLK